jgi:outer membrane receptor for ferric coprogen and ferric-rhodotorulic acid
MKTAQTSHRPLVPRTIAAHAALTATRIAGLTATLLAGLIPVAAQIAPSLPTPVQTASAITLSPFEVNTTKDTGFAAANAGTATRLTLDMRDVPAAFSVMTSEFIDALAIVNVGEAASWMPNGSTIEPQDNVQQPMQYNTRGVNNNSGQQRNNYLTNGLLESYALERYEFGRGPNAALFNIGAQSSLSGGLGAQTKKARYDRSFDTVAVSYGSWDYQRTTVDVNRPITDKLAIRANAVWFDKGGWRMAQWEKTKGATATAAYLLTPKTELRVEGAYDSTQRNNDTNSIFDSLSGWDGATVFRGPVTNAILGTQTTPGSPNSFGQILTFQGERQGVNRRSSEYYVWDPFSGQNLIMNYQNEATTRRADETANTPILANGVLYIRGTGLPFGNGGGALNPTLNQNPSGSAQLLYMNNSPPDLYARAINGSSFRIPSKRFTGAGFDSPAYTQTTKDVNVALSHQIRSQWFFEIGGDINQVDTVTARDGATTVRTVRIDINQLLPNGAPNPHFLQTYGDAPLAYTYRNFINRGVRGNAAYKLNAGRWGDYTFNLNLSSSLRTTENRTRRFSLAHLPDPRMWTSTATQVNLRQYWSNPSRPYGDAGIPTTLSRNVFATDNNSATTTTSTIAPRWVISTWNDTDEKFDNAVFALSAKYFGGKLVLLGASRYDKYSSQLRSQQEFGDLPVDWDAQAKLYKPTAPADWATLSYLPRNATTGVATSAKPVPAVTRPRQNAPGVVTNNGVQIYNPFFTGDRFRNDYSPPLNAGRGLTGTYGLVYHAHKNVSLVANYSTSYIPPPTNAFTLDNELVQPLTGLGYDGGLRFNFFNGRLTLNTNYFFNREDHQRIASPATASINGLLSRNATNDASLDGRNNQGIPDIFGTDYQSAKTSGVEFEVVGTLTRGWRLMFNLGTAKVLTSNRYPLSKILIPENTAAYRQVLEDAGGRLDISQHPNGAPGLASVNPTSTAALASEQANAVIDFNNIWANYALVVGDQPTLGQERTAINAFSDYTVQSGRLKGLRLGFGGQYAGRYFVGTRSGDSIVNPSNPSTAIDDPTVDQTSRIYARRPVILTATLGYSLRLKGSPRWEGKELSFRLLVKNIMNNQMIIYDDANIVARPPNGDYSKPNRVGVLAFANLYTEPVSFVFTTTLKL